MKQRKAQRSGIRRNGGVAKIETARKIAKDGAAAHQRWRRGKLVSASISEDENGGGRIMKAISENKHQRRRHRKYRKYRWQ
jgi:hypothetical protein